MLVSHTCTFRDVWLWWREDRLLKGGSEYRIKAIEVGRWRGHAQLSLLRYSISQISGSLSLQPLQQQPQPLAKPMLPPPPPLQPRWGPDLVASVKHARHLCDPIPIRVGENGVRWRRVQWRSLCPAGSHGHVNQKFIDPEIGTFFPSCGKKMMVPWQHTTGVPASSTASQEVLKALLSGPLPHCSSPHSPTTPHPASKMITFFLVPGTGCGGHYLPGQAHKLPVTSLLGHGQWCFPETFQEFGLYFQEFFHWSIVACSCRDGQPPFDKASKPYMVLLFLCLASVDSAIVSGVACSEILLTV